MQIIMQNYFYSELTYQSDHSTLFLNSIRGYSL